MNNTKRLLALVMTLAMLMSMLSGLGFALDVKAAGTDIDIGGTGVGANPTTDEPTLDVMADDVFIVDSSLSVNDETYSLVWNNEQTDGIPVADKVFKSLYAVQYYATVNGIENPKVIVKKIDSNLDAIDITMALEIYTQAYNTMPYVTSDASLDKWGYNIDDRAYDDYADLTYALPVIKIGENVTGKVGIYGATIAGLVNSDRKGALDIELVNVTIDGDESVVFALSNAVLEVANTDSLLLKNVYVRKTAQSAVLFDGFIAANTVIDGLYVDCESNALSTVSSVKQAGLKSSLVIKNSYFAATGLPFTLAGDPDVKMQRSAIKTVKIQNNIFAGLSDVATPITVTIAPARYTGLVFSNNYVACANGTGVLFGSADSEVFNLTKFEVEIRDNILNGIAANFGFNASGATLRDCKMDVADNYLTTVYSDNLDNVEGVELVSTAHGVVCKSYYLDYKMTRKSNSAVAVLGATATNGDVFVNNSTNTIFYIMNTGDASELTVQFSNPETIFKWFDGEDCTNEVMPQDINTQTESDTFYLRSEYSNSEGVFIAEPYKVTIVRDTPSIPYFSKTYVDEAGLLSANAIFCDISCGWVTDGSLYTVEWQGESYTFIKGVNLFDNIDNAISFAKSNSIENPEFVLIDMNGSHNYSSRWMPTYPGKYFTANYATPAHIGKAGDAPELWTSNIGTGEGKFDIDKGITIGGMNISGNEVAGTYELYGFTLRASTLITDGRNSNRPGCINIHLENCFFDNNSWSWALFTANDNAPTTSNPTEDFLYIKNSYLDSHGTGYRLFSGWQFSDITFDGVFFNVGAFSTAQDYFKQNTNTASFRIINSHIKNYSTVLNGQGKNAEIKAGENATFEISNNIFNNARLGTNSAVAAYTRAWNKIIIKDNIFINDNIEKFDMFKVLYGATASGNPCLLEVTGNRAYNMLGTFDFGSRAITSASKVENNYVTAGLYQGGDTVTYGGIKLTALNGGATLKTGDYWVDSDMTIRPNVIMSDYDFVGKNVVTDKTAKTVKYVLLENDPAVTVSQTPAGYEYVISLGHIVDNKYGNKMTIKDAANAKNAADVKSELTIKSANELETISLLIDVSSPDGSAPAETYAVTITGEGPFIDNVKVGDTDATYEDGKFYVEISGRGMNEEITATVPETAEFTVTKDGEPVTGVTTLNGSTETYTISSTLGGETVTVDLVVTRRGAEFDAFDAVLKITDGVDDSDFLPGFRGVFQSLRAKMSAIDRENAVQSEVDEFTEKMQKLVNEAVTESEFNAQIKEYKKIKNTDGKYCIASFEALQLKIDNAYDAVKFISDLDSYNAMMAEVDAAAKALSGHKFGEYTHDEGSETCIGNGTKSSVCLNDGCDEKITIEETEDYATGVHEFTNYVYNEDATHLADGTKTAMCDGCNKVADTKTAEGTKLVIINSATKFTDVAEKDWFKQAVDYVATYKFMNGTSDTTFAPTKTLTRAEFVMLLANLYGADVSDNSVKTKFTDLKEGAWYVGAVKWASDNGIVTGTSDTTFAPNSVISREQMCVMIVNYTKFAKITLKTPNDKVAFSDDAKISAWAKDAVYACQRAGLVSGKGTGFDPSGTALRAEAAAVIKNFHENYLLA